MGFIQPVSKMLLTATKQNDILTIINNRDCFNEANCNYRTKKDW